MPDTEERSSVVFLSHSRAIDITETQVILGTPASEKIFIIIMRQRGCDCIGMVDEIV